MSTDKSSPSPKPVRKRPPRIPSSFSGVIRPKKPKKTRKGVGKDDVLRSNVKKVSSKTKKSKTLRTSSSSSKLQTKESKKDNRRSGSVGSVPNLQKKRSDDNLGNLNLSQMKKKERNSMLSKKGSFENLKGMGLPPKIPRQKPKKKFYGKMKGNPFAKKPPKPKLVGKEVKLGSPKPKPTKPTTLKPVGIEVRLGSPKPKPVGKDGGMKERPLIPPKPKSLGKDIGEKISGRPPKPKKLWMDKGVHPVRKPPMIPDQKKKPVKVKVKVKVKKKKEEVENEDEGGTFKPRYSSDFSGEDTDDQEESFKKKKKKDDDSLKSHNLKLELDKIQDRKNMTDVKERKLTGHEFSFDKRLERVKLTQSKKKNYRKSIRILEKTKTLYKTQKIAVVDLKNQLLKLEKLQEQLSRISEDPDGEDFEFSYDSLKTKKLEEDKKLEDLSEKEVTIEEKIVKNTDDAISLLIEDEMEDINKEKSIFAINSNLAQKTFLREYTVLKRNKGRSNLFQIKKTKIWKILYSKREIHEFQLKTKKKVEVQELEDIIYQRDFFLKNINYRDNAITVSYNSNVYEITFENEEEKKSFLESMFLLKGIQFYNPFLIEEFDNRHSSKKKEEVVKVKLFHRNILGDHESKNTDHHIDLELVRQYVHRLEVLAFSWNMRNRDPPVREDLREYISPLIRNDDFKIDLFCVCVQNAPRMSYVNLRDVLVDCINGFDDFGKTKTLETAKRLQYQYAILQYELNDIKLILFINKKIKNKIFNIQVGKRRLNYTRVKKEMKLGGKIKGGVCLSFQYCDRSFLFINMKLFEEQLSEKEAGVEMKYYKRQFHKLLDNMVVCDIDAVDSKSKSDQSYQRNLTKTNGFLEQFDHVFLMANLNLRIEDVLFDSKDKIDIAECVKGDLLNKHKKHYGWCYAFKEPKITFQPKINHTHKIMSYPNRILYYDPGEQITEGMYECITDIKTSQDNPLMASFSVKCTIPYLSFIDGSNAKKDGNGDILNFDSKTSDHYLVCRGVEISGLKLGGCWLEFESDVIKGYRTTCKKGDHVSWNSLEKMRITVADLWFVATDYVRIIVRNHKNTFVGVAYLPLRDAVQKTLENNTESIESELKVFKNGSDTDGIIAIDWYVEM